MARSDLRFVPALSLYGRRERLIANLSERIDPSAMARANLVAARTGQPVEQVLNQLGVLTDDDLASAYAAICDCDIWNPDLKPATADIEALGVTVEFLRRTRVLPIEDIGGVLTCAACDPLDEEVLSGLRFATGREIAVMVARFADWSRSFDLLYSEVSQPEAGPDERRLEREIDQVVDGSSTGFGARLVTAAFEAALSVGASDIHFEPRRHDLHIRLRVDGRLVDYQTASADLSASAVSRIKVIANLDVAEKRLPQDGRTTFIVGGRQVDVRVATSPTVFGEAAVLRILDRTSVPLDLDGLGLGAPIAAVLRRAASAPHGLYLVTGPTGSGKTTTLYALLQTFAGSHRKVLSVEDPVEFHFEHVTQTQVSPQIGLTFARALRSFLRQDPDVILVGEIRDPETAAVAVQAAMTGHLVLASIHANDALAVAPRLRDMGIEPYQLAAAFRGASAQRLVRRLCPACSQRREASAAEIRFALAAGLTQPQHAYEAVGCPACKQIGFRGRLPISEAFLADEAFLRCITEQAPRPEVERIAQAAGLKSMTADGLNKAASGLTTFDEVMAAVDG